MSAWFWVSFRTPPFDAVDLADTQKAGTCFLAFVWAYFRLPECKSRSYRELDILFERGIPARKFKETVVDDKEEE